MRKILPYLFGLRALIVIVVMVAGIAGFNLRADATGVEPTPEPTPTETTPAPEPTETITPEDLPELQAGLTADEPTYTTVVLSDSQVEQIREGTTATTWALCVLVFCSIVQSVLLAKGQRT